MSLDLTHEGQIGTENVLAFVLFQGEKFHMDVATTGDVMDRSDRLAETACAPDPSRAGDLVPASQPT